MKIENVPGYPGYYISKRGILWSRRKNKKKWRKLKPYLNTRWNRYQFILMDKDGERFLWKRSRLVALAWVPNPKPSLYTVVMHLDNDSTNDHYRNLKWGTQKENIRQCVQEGHIFRNETYYNLINN